MIATNISKRLHIYAGPWLPGEVREIPDILEVKDRTGKVISKIPLAANLRKSAVWRAREIVEGDARHQMPLPIKAGMKGLRDMSASQAIATVNGETDPEMLAIWHEAESRPDVKAAIESRGKSL